MGRRCARRRPVIWSLGRSAAVLLSLRSAILRLARRRTVALRRRASVPLRGSAVLGRSAAVALRRSPAVLLRRRRLLLWIRRVGRRPPLLGVGRRLSAAVGKTAGRADARDAALLRVRRVRRRRLLLGVRRVRRLLLRVAAALRRPLRHEGIALLPRWGLSLAGRRVALLRWRVAVSRLRRPVAVARLRRRVAVAITGTGRPARRKHRAARTCVEIKFRAPHAIDAMLSP